MAAVCQVSVGHQENWDDSQSIAPEIHPMMQLMMGLWDVFPSITAHKQHSYATFKEVATLHAFYTDLQVTHRRHLNTV